MHAYYQSYRYYNSKAKDFHFNSRIHFTEAFWLCINTPIYVATALLHNHALATPPVTYLGRLQHLSIGELIVPCQDPISKITRATLLHSFFCLAGCFAFSHLDFNILSNDQSSAKSTKINTIIHYVLRLYIIVHEIQSLVRVEPACSVDSGNPSRLESYNPGCD